MSNRTILGGIAMNVVILIAGFMLATIIVSISWGVMIHEKAFHCSDDTGAMLGFFGDMESHRQASDKLASGWTWGRIEVIREMHLLAFWLLVIGPFCVTWISSLFNRTTRAIR